MIQIDVLTGIFLLLLACFCLGVVYIILLIRLNRMAKNVFKVISGIFRMMLEIKKDNKKPKG